MERKVQYHKLGNKDKLKLLNEMIVELERRKASLSTNDFLKMSREERIKYIDKIDEDEEQIKSLNEEINKLISYAPDLSDKLYLTDVIDIEKPKFGDNNLIISPVGSGKTTLITERLVEDEDKTYLMLVSTQSLKDSLAPNDNKIRETYANRMFTSKNKSVFGSKMYKIYVMTYAEFGEKIYANNEFLIKNKIDKIFCDEIHSLPAYIKYGGGRNLGLAHAQRLLFNKIEGVQVFYFTATDSNIIQEENERIGTLSSIEIFNYSNYPNIMRYMPMAVREINNVEQIRNYLKDRKLGFKYYNYKGMAFSKTISSLKKIEKIVIEEGYNPLVLWSENNGEHKMTKEQKEARKKLLETNEIPEPYNFLIFNSALQEGWNLKDDSVKLAILNTTNETEYIQALGRLRRDVDLLIYRTNDKKIDTTNSNLVIPDGYIDVPLNSEMKEQLAREINIINTNKKNASWTTIKKILSNDSKYEVKDSTKNIDGKRTRITIISQAE